MGGKGLRARLRYKFDASMTHGTPALVGWLALVSLVVILFAGAVIAIGGIRSAGDAQVTFGEGVWQSLMRTLDAGTMGGDQGWSFRAVMLVVTLAGIFLVSALIGILSAGLDARLDQLRKGRSLVLERGHTIIYNWSPSIFDVIAELAIANRSRRRPRIVVLGPRDKVEMEEEIARKVPDLGRTRVICRTGDTADLGDISIANPHAARSIVILSAEGDDDPDSGVIKTILALVNDPQRRPEPYRIAAEIRDAHNVDVAHVVGGEEVQLVLADELIARIIVQSTRRPGLSAVFADLLDFDGCEIYTVPQPELAGRSFADAVLAYDHCTLLGLAGPDGRVRLNPPGDTIVGVDDKLVLIAEDDSAVALSGTPPRIERRAAIARLPVPPRAERLLMIGWNRRGPLIVRELASYAPPGSTLTIAAHGAGGGTGIADALPPAGNLRVEVRATDTGSRAAIAALDPVAYDHVIVLGYDGEISAQAADTRTLVTLLYLRQIAEGSGGRLEVVSEMIDVRNRALAEVALVNDFVVSNKLVSLMLAQASEDPHLEAIFAELLTAEGSEIYFRPADDYVPAFGPVSFHQIAATACALGEVAIGIARAGGEIALNPDRRVAQTYGPDDRIIVLARE